MRADTCRSRMATSAPERYPVEVGRSCSAIIRCYVWPARLTRLTRSRSDAANRCRGGAPTGSCGWKWSPRAQSWLRVLRNPVYLGKIAHGGDLHDGEHQPIVDESVFASAQRPRTSEPPSQPRFRPTTSEYLLSGNLRLP
jgi:hypothetical protein